MILSSYSGINKVNYDIGSALSDVSYSGIAYSITKIYELYA